MRGLAALAAIAVPALANAQSTEPVKFNCDVSHIHVFNADGSPSQAPEKDAKAQYVILIGNDSVRVDKRSASRNEVVVYRVLMHSATEYIGAMAPAKSSDAAVSIAKGANANNTYSGVVTAVAGGSIKVTALLCLKAP